MRKIYFKYNGPGGVHGLVVSSHLLQLRIGLVVYTAWWCHLIYSNDEWAWWCTRPGEVDFDARLQ